MKRFLIILTVIVLSNSVKAQIGLTSFIPIGGNMAFPAAPFTYKQDIHIKSFPYIYFQPSVSCYTIGGMLAYGIGDSYDTKKPLIGEFTSFLFSITPAFNFPMFKNVMNIDIFGGYFFSFNIAPQCLYNNFNKMLLKYEGWDACTADVSFSNRIPSGLVVGINLNIRIKKLFEISPGLSYYLGSSKLKMNGTYYGGKLNDIVSEKSFDFPDSKLDYQGFAVNIYFKFKNIKDYNDLYKSLIHSVQNKL